MTVGVASSKSGSLSPQALSALLASQIPGAHLVMAHERLLPVHPVLAPLFGVSSDDPLPLGLVRGHTLACTGSAAMSSALAVLVAPTQSGSWAGVVGLPSVGVLAAADLGVALERTIFVSDPMGARNHREQRPDVAAVLSALVDGVDVLLLAQRLVTSLPLSLMRRVQTRVQTRGGILVIVGDPAPLSVDIRLNATTVEWQGVGTGHGHLQRRRVVLQLDGRRRARATEHEVWLPDAQGQLSAVVQQSEKSAVAEQAGVVVPLRRTG